MVVHKRRDKDAWAVVTFRNRNGKLEKTRNAD